jgi:hypothetical protein
MYRTQFRETARRRGSTHPPSLFVGRPETGAELRAALRHYEQHVIAWYALGRVSEARAARATIERLRRASGVVTRTVHLAGTT